MESFLRSFFVVVLSFVFLLCVENGEGRAYGRLWSRQEMVEMAGYGEEKLSSVFVIGSLLCRHPSNPSSPIPGASVAVKCHAKKKRRSAWIKAVTDEYGDFTFDLPSHLHAIPNLEKTCLVRVLSLPKNSKCSPALVNQQRALKIVSSGNGIRVYTAGCFRFHHVTRRSSQARITQNNM